MASIDKFCKKYHLTLTSVKVPDNPNMSDPKWQANHYHCTIVKQGSKTLVTYFSKGLGLKDRPSVEEVLDCLASDASSVDNSRTFEDWASELGYDEDSRKAEQTYNICVKQAKELKSFLGSALYDELLWKTDRE